MASAWPSMPLDDADRPSDVRPREATEAAQRFAGDDRDVGHARTAWAAGRAPTAVGTVLDRMPPAPTGRTRRAALLTGLDTQLRC